MSPTFDHDRHLHFEARGEARAERPRWEQHTAGLAFSLVLGIAVAWIFWGAAY